MSIKTTTLVSTWLAFGAGCVGGKAEETTDTAESVTTDGTIIPGVYSDTSAGDTGFIGTPPGTTSAGGSGYIGTPPGTTSAGGSGHAATTSGTTTTTTGTAPGGSGY